MSEEPLKPRSHFWRYISDFLLCRSPGRLGSDIALTIEQPVGGPSSDLGAMANVPIVAEDIQDTMPSLDVRGSTGITGSVQEGKMVDDQPKVDDHSNLDTKSLSESRPFTNHPSKAAKPEAETMSDALTSLNVNHSVVREEAQMAEDQPLITDYQSSDPDNESPSSRPTEIPADRLPKDAESKARVGWMAFRATLKIAKECADAFPPLKAAVGGLSAVLDRVDEVNDAATDFADVKSQIDAFAETLRDHQVRFSEPSLALRRRVDGLARALDLQKSSIEDKVDRGIIKRIIESSDDKAEIARHLRTLGHLVNQFTIATALNTDANVEEMRKDAKLDKLNHVAEAAFNGPQSSGKGCMPGTRISVLSELLSWALDPGAPKLYWLTGLAGTGKSAIAYSLCRLLDDAGLLGASFFCSRQASSEQKDIFRVLPTLACLLARTSSSFAVALLECLDKCPDAAKLSLAAQFGTLLMEPCDLLPHDESRVYVFVVDALDECDNSEEVGRFLQLVIDAGHALKLKIFMTSRPEHQIRQELTVLKSNQILYLHKIEETLVQADIRLYINHHLLRIFKKYHSKIEISSKQVDILVQQSGSLFIYAFTVLQYIGSKNVDPQHRLNKLINENSAMTRSIGNQLDALYRFVFQEVFKDLDEDEITLIKHCFSCILASFELMSIETMCTFMAKEYIQIRSALSGFHSLLEIPDDNNIGLVSAFHASFGDYVTNVKLYKHSIWYINISETHYYMTSQCMDIMKQNLKFNISECKTSYLPNAQQPMAQISQAIIYACSHWIEHLALSSNPEHFCETIEIWLKNQFFYWLEVMSMMKMIKNVITILEKTHKVYNQFYKRSASFAQLLDDLCSFVDHYHVPIAQSIPHIYISALPYGFNEFKSFKIYENMFQNLLLAHQSECKKTIVPPIISINGHDAIIRSIGFSPNGNFVISTTDHTIKIWKSNTGESVIDPLIINNDIIKSIIFSANGQHIIAALESNQIYIWKFNNNVITEISKSHINIGRIIAISSHFRCATIDSTMIHIWNFVEPNSPSKKTSFIIHLKDIVGVWAAFSSNDRYLICGNGIYDMEMFNVQTGAATVYIEPDNMLNIWSNGSHFRDKSAISGACSFGGMQIVYGSYNGAIYLYDTYKKEIIETLKEESDSYFLTTSSVAFSFDDQYIVSGLSNGRICIWKPSFSQLDLLGHDSSLKFSTTKFISSLAVSFDNRHIVGGGGCGQIFIWTQKLDQTRNEIVFTAHHHPILAIAISSDGKYIASGSRDKTVCIWNLTTCQAVGKPLEKHKGFVTALSFSPDGQYIVSGSNDRTFIVWSIDLEQNKHKALLHKRVGTVNSIAFSPDSRLIVVGSDGSYSLDNSIFVFDLINQVFIARDIAIEDGVTVTSVAFSPDERHIAFSSQDKILFFCDIYTSNMYGWKDAHDDLITSLTFSTDGQYIISGSKDKTIRVWHIDRGLLGKPIEGHTDWITSVVASPDEKSIISASWDGTVRIWKIAFDSLDINVTEQYMPLKIKQDITNLALWNELTEYYKFVSEKYPLPPPKNGGWIWIAKNMPLFWIPAHYIENLCWPHGAQLLGNRKPWSTLDLSQFVHGESWVSCKT